LTYAFRAIVEGLLRKHCEILRCCKI